MQEVDLKVRNNTFDIVKAIALLGVVLGHVLSNYEIETKLIWIIYFTRMPLFFFVSGFFLERSVSRYTAKELIGKKIKSLLLPYFIWSTIALCANVASVGIANGFRFSKEWFLGEVSQIFIQGRSVWYLLILFISSVIYVAIKKSRNFFAWSIVTWLAVSILFPGQLFNMYKFKWLFPFLVLGGIFAKYEEWGALRSKKNRWSCVGIVAFLCVCVISYKEGYFVEYSTFEYSSVVSILMGMLYYVISCGGIYCTVLFARVLQGIDIGAIKKMNSFIACVGRYSLDIYLLHMMLISFVPFDIKSVLRQDFWIVGAVVYAILIMMFLTILAKYLLCKISLYNFSTGRNVKRKKEKESV